MNVDHHPKDLRQQLIDLLNESRAQYNLKPPPPRIAATLVHDFLPLLQDPEPRSIGLRWRLISHGHLHRHVICIRCPDQAFYLDALKGYFLRRNIQPLERHTIIARMEEEKGGYRLASGTADGRQNGNFMLITLHISATMLPEGQHLSQDLQALLHAVELSVKDFPAMHEALEMCAKKLKDEAPESAALLRWMDRDKYIFHGMQWDKKRLGLLKNRKTAERIVKGALHELDNLPPPRKPGLEWLLLHTTQSHLYSTVNIECVRVCWHDDEGGLASLIILGHFSRSARHANASHIPLLRTRWKSLLTQPLLKQSTFYRREIRTIFDRLPKPLLLSVSPLELLEPMVAIANLTGPTQTHTALFHPGPDGMHLLLAAIPADRFGPNVLNRILRHLNEIGIIEHAYHAFGIGTHQLLLIACTCKKKRQNIKKAGKVIQDSVLFWKDAAKEDILEHARQLDVPTALAELEKLPFLYQNLFPPERLIDHMKARDWVLEHDRIHVQARNFDSGVELDIFSPAPLPLGELVSTVQGFGLTAQQEEVVELERGGKKAHLSNLRCTTSRPPRIEDIGRLTLGLDRVLNHEADDEPANALILAAGLDIQQVTIIITLRNHLIQLLADAAPTPLTNMLRHHPKVTARLYRMFEARHRPSMPRSYEEQARQEFEKALEQVENLTDDRWFRALGELVHASVRTNAYARNPWEAVAIKIDPRQLSYAPKPLPYREIFVHGVHVEGVHLRGGPIARGGLRFSDRTADFRTEVLELMATQVTKNSLIVPTGAKGGFIIRRGQFRKEPFIRQQYRLFIRALLSLTDNIVQGEHVPPTGIRIPDEDANDAYLVVAADKGTARYSDFANEESQTAGFWLDDAFASGGRHGYDHKEVGITARGAWVCAAYHFHTLGTDAWQDPISVVGIGDMSGDVFGNGMLLNPNIRLLGAFNHRHIFLDPAPDTAKAYAERRRLFDNALGWDHYDKGCISKGGGVFERSAKRIPLPESIQQVLGIESAALSGEALIRALLTAPVDLLYNGGIGTYVKASGEPDSEVRDPANNAVRVTADRLRCKVVGEGGNLGFTQRGRLQYAEDGGLINTDAIDNSAGVDMSDHEVNLKILFAAMAQPLPLHRRNRILKGLTEVVTEQCLDDNLAQSKALSLAQMEVERHPSRIRRLRDMLIAEGRIDPQTDPRMDEDETLGLRPQLAVLLGHEKNRVHERLSGCREQAGCFRQELLHTYFPPRIRRRFGSAIDTHPLADNIVHTMAANYILNHIGLGAIQHLETILDQPAEEIVPALLVAEFILDTMPLRRAIWQEARNADTALRLQRSLQEHLTWFAEGLLRLCPVEEMSRRWMEKQRTSLQRFRHSLSGHGGEETENRYGMRLKEASRTGLTPGHAAHFAAIPELAQTAVALRLSDRLTQPMRRCLKANQICLQLLPLGEAERELRSPDWDAADVYELRREWLHRLIRLESRAVEQLTTMKARNLHTAGESIWKPHPHWHSVQEMRLRLAHDELDRMGFLLLLTRLESLIEES